MPKIERKSHTIDASGKAVGRLATEIAVLLRGKHKPEYQPNIDGGDIVEVSNIKQVKFTGDKLTQKIYYRYSGYPGGLKKTKMSDVFTKNPAEVLRRAVWNMLPKNKLKKEMIKRLKIR